MLTATFNANSIRTRKEIIKDWLEEKSPDILCIQETKVQDKDFPSSFFEDIGYNVYFSGQKSYNGVAVLSREEALKVEYGLDTEPEDKSRLVYAQYPEINIVNTYIPQGNSPDSDKFQYKLDWYKRLKAFFSRKFSPEDNVLWLGDMNVAPENIDVHNPEGLLGHVCFRQETWDAFKDVMNWGFTDILRKHYPEDVIYTFWDYRAGSFPNNKGWRIDHILATAPLSERSIKCFVDLEPRKKHKPSDHTFLAAEFDI
ncbi:exodeoxyribonuclease III [Sedimentisphaera salicampi]|uniref:Exodeoxyribonuclease III n=1 Tax=Sedimentisphaera salicampi TaxID=1941349 RepID=A0A1W6LJB8_9BACT|nr:exodeoxyribonuclease III [Sedimentisphaera salicampi]ARN55888.1 Exodeoxyribonuclease III [Sedimentisphaera salicampi]OXU16079.1 Exodeoxyribonuclease III [Sedimentisphaera salicampi]